jgi:hypothetical protein
MKWTRALPKVGARLHYYSGHRHTSWTAELRAVVDVRHLVIREWSREKQTWRYRIESRSSWEGGAIQPGPLPTTKAKALKDLEAQGRFPSAEVKAMVDYEWRSS